MQSYIDEIKLCVTGGILELELSDDVLQRIVQSAMREMQRYICSTKIVTVPYKKAIDVKDMKVNAIARVYRADGTTSSSEDKTTDPVAVSLWQLTSNMGNMYNFTEYAYRYAAYNTLQQIGNTMSTDLAFFYDDASCKLYINTRLEEGSPITIEYIPRYDNVEEITSDFWIDVLMRLSKALTKITLGRVRGRYTQSNALWTSDAATMLQEGQTELTELRNYLQTNTQLLYAID
jgi:hypothetical protein